MSSMHLSGITRQAETTQAPTVSRLERNEPAAVSGQDLPPGKLDQAENVAAVASAVTRISDYVQNYQRDLNFSFDEQSGRAIVKVIDSETNEVIRQIPSEETLRIAEHLDSPESLILSEMA